ncbi:hypothetical protein MTO96_001920 [Rhipicephalus appendiculatus]
MSGTVARQEPFARNDVRRFTREVALTAHGDDGLFGKGSNFRAALRRTPAEKGGREPRDSLLKVLFPRAQQRRRRVDRGRRSRNAQFAVNSVRAHTKHAHWPSREDRLSQLPSVWVRTKAAGRESAE